MFAQPPFGSYLVCVMTDFVWLYHPTERTRDLVWIFWGRRGRAVVSFGLVWVLDD